MTPYYSDNLVTIYNADSRNIIDSINDGFALLTDPVYGINGGKGGDSKYYKKGNYEGMEWSDTEEYVETVCVQIVKSLLKKAVRGAVTPGIRCLHLYPRPSDMGCFWTPASCTHGPWGFGTMQPILYYGKDFRAGKGPLPSGKAVTEPSEKNGHPCQSQSKHGRGSLIKFRNKTRLLLTLLWEAEQHCVRLKILTARLLV